MNVTLLYLRAHPKLSGTVVVILAELRLYYTAASQRNPRYDTS